MKKQEKDRARNIYEEILRRDDIAKFTYEDYLRCMEQRKKEGKENSENIKSKKNKTMLF